MLAYLEDLCGALIAHDSVAIQRLLAHPLARSLPRQVREEAIAISRANATSLRAPIQTLRFYHQTLQLGAPDHGAQPGELASDDSTADPAQGAPAVVISPAPSVRDGLRGGIRDGVRHVTTSTVHATGREQIELPLDPPRQAHAVAA